MDNLLPVKILRFLICQFLKDVERQISLGELLLELMKLGHSAFVHATVSGVVVLKTIP